MPETPYASGTSQLPVPRLRLHSLAPSTRAPSWDPLACKDRGTTSVTPPSAALALLAGPGATTKAMVMQHAVQAPSVRAQNRPWRFGVVGEIVVPSGVTSAVAELFALFEAHGDVAAGGWVDACSLNVSATQRLRELAASIQVRGLVCGKPMSVDACFWRNDLVSGRAMLDFSWEQPLWKWVARSFSVLAKSSPACLAKPHECRQLAFLDVGVNVGDWFAPLRVSMPHVPIFGIEGSPSIAAIALANVAAACRANRRTSAAAGATKLLPFALLSAQGFHDATQMHGTCLGTYDSKTSNFGESKAIPVGELLRERHVAMSGKGDQNKTAMNGSMFLDRPGIKNLCPASKIAGAANFTSAMRALVPQSATRGSKWPRVFIAKLDIEGLELETLKQGFDWLTAQPPCYLMMELRSSTSRKIGWLLESVGYGVIWRAGGSKGSHVWGEFPPSRPFFRQQRGFATALSADLASLKGPVWAYRDYIFGRVAAEACVERLVAHP